MTRGVTHSKRCVLYLAWLDGHFYVIDKIHVHSPQPTSGGTQAGTHGRTKQKKGKTHVAIDLQ